MVKLKFIRGSPRSLADTATVDPPGDASITAPRLALGLAIADSLIGPKRPYGKRATTAGRLVPGTGKSPWLLRPVCVTIGPGYSQDGEPHHCSAGRLGSEPRRHRGGTAQDRPTIGPGTVEFAHRSHPRNSSRVSRGSPAGDAGTASPEFRRCG
jgi:hypothetical protein